MLVSNYIICIAIRYILSLMKYILFMLQGLQSRQRSTNIKIQGVWIRFVRQKSGKFAILSNDLSSLVKSSKISMIYRS